MGQPDNEGYYRLRAAASHEMARRAASPAVAAIHIELAMRYDRLATQPGQSDGIMPR